MTPEESELVTKGFRLIDESLRMISKTASEALATARLAVRFTGPEESINDRLDRIEKRLNDLRQQPSDNPGSIHLINPLLIPSPDSGARSIDEYAANTEVTEVLYVKNNQVTERKELS